MVGGEVEGGEGVPVGRVGEQSIELGAQLLRPTIIVVLKYLVYTILLLVNFPQGCVVTREITSLVENHPHQILGLNSLKWGKSTNFR